MTYLHANVWCKHFGLGICAITCDVITCFIVCVSTIQYALLCHNPLAIWNSNSMPAHYIITINTMTFSFQCKLTSALDDINFWLSKYVFNVIWISDAAHYLKEEFTLVPLLVRTECNHGNYWQALPFFLRLLFGYYIASSEKLLNLIRNLGLTSVVFSLPFALII